VPLCLRLFASVCRFPLFCRVSPFFAGFPLALARGPQPCPCPCGSFPTFPLCLRILFCLTIFRILCGFPLFYPGFPLPRGFIAGFPLALARGPQPCPAVPAAFSSVCRFPLFCRVSPFLQGFPSRLREGPNRAPLCLRIFPCVSKVVFLADLPLRLRCRPFLQGFPSRSREGPNRDSFAAAHTPVSRLAESEGNSETMAEKKAQPKGGAPGQGRGETRGMKSAKRSGVPCPAFTHQVSPRACARATTVPLCLRIFSSVCRFPLFCRVSPRARARAPPLPRGACNFPALFENSFLLGDFPHSLRFSPLLSWFPLALARGPQPCPAVPADFPLCVKVCFTCGFASSVAVSPLFCRVSPRARARAPTVKPLPRFTNAFPLWPNPEEMQSENRTIKTSPREEPPAKAGGKSGE
jgi:hypothetical protein